MKLDQTFIAIRERSTLEIFDLALQVTRQHFIKLLSLLLLGTAPWMLLNWLLLGWIVTNEAYLDYGIVYYCLMLILIVSQAQVATAMITYYLGQSMFIAELTVQQAVRESFRKPWLYWWLHGILRLLFPIVAIAVWAWVDGETALPATIFFTSMLLILALIIRAGRPFVTEILLLEKTPARVTNSKRINFSRRSTNLHRNAGGELFNRALVGSFLFPLLFLSIYASFNLLDDALAVQPGFEFSLNAIYWTLALWLTVGFSAVVRFLSYVDIRIRQEGWAVELKMRAEGIRLSGADLQ